MKTFMQWVEENKLELPALTDAEEGKEATSENRARTGVGPQYPDAYFMAQYPHKYSNPTKATTDLDLSNAKKKHDVPGAGNTTVN